MRLSEDQIRQGLLHEEGEVRLAALRYFAEGQSPDPAVMQTVIEALERYGRRDAFTYTHLIAGLAQTEETLRWVIGELRNQPGESIEERNYLNHLSRLLCSADPRLLLPHEEEILESPGFSEDLAEAFRHRLALLSWDGEALWRELEAICEEGKDKDYVGDFRYDEAKRIVEALGHEGSRHAERMMGLLAITIEDFENNPQKWMEPLMVRLAGQLCHEPAVPLIVGKMHDEDDEVTSDEAITALTRIGTDGVVQALWDAYPAGNWHFRLYALGPLGQIHSDLAVAACLDLLAKETDGDLQVHLVTAVTDQFSFEGNEAVRKLLVEEGDMRDARDSLVAACTLMGQTFPELEGWRKEIEQEKEEWRRRAERRWRPAPILPRGPVAAPRPLPEPPPPPPQRPHLRVDKKVGRNDPCPCGSGKKFKKCCMSKQGGL